MNRAGVDSDSVGKSTDQEPIANHSRERERGVRDQEPIAAARCLFIKTEKLNARTSKSESDPLLKKKDESDPAIQTGSKSWTWSHATAHGTTFQTFEQDKTAACSS